MLQPQQSSTPQALTNTSGPQEDLRSEEKLYGPLSKDDFLRYAPRSPNDSQYVLQQLDQAFSDIPEHEKANAQRAQMWKNFERMLDAVEQNPRNLPLVELIFSEIQEISAFARTQLGSEVKTGLGLHLQEITKFCREFFLTDDGHSRFPTLISDRNAALLADVIAPVHDVLKYLGSMDAQIMPDHEVMTAAMIDKTWYQKKVAIGGHTFKLSKRDVAFLSGVIGDHENINKELGRAEWIFSKSEIERAKALFFVADVLTGAIQPDPSTAGAWKIDAEQLDKRFIDLYFRHIDPVKGKVFRPEWALHAVDDLSNTIDALIRNGSDIRGSAPAQSARETLIDAALEGIKRSLDAEAERWRSARAAGTAYPDKFLDEEQLRRVVDTQSKLQDLKANSLLNRLH